MIHITESELSQRIKLIQQWKLNTPQDAPLESVLAVIKYFFESYEQNGTSHIHIIGDRIYETMGQVGLVSVPITGGQKVKGYYLKRLAETIEIVCGVKI